MVLVPIRIKGTEYVFQHEQIKWHCKFVYKIVPMGTSVGRKNIC